MTAVEFGKNCRPNMKKYYELFHETPSPSDYTGNRKQFLIALQKACENGRKIDEFLERLTSQEGVK